MYLKLNRKQPTITVYVFPKM